MPSARTLLVASSLVAFLAHCTGKSSPQSTTCVPGDTRACVGPGACAGAQACGDDGRTWLECDCGASMASDAGAVSDAGASDAGAVSDAGASDAGASDATTQDAGFTPNYVLIDDMEGSSTPTGPIRFNLGAVDKSPGYWCTGRSTGSQANTMSPDPFAYESLAVPHTTQEGITSTRAVHLTCSISDLYGYCVAEFWPAQSSSDPDPSPDAAGTFAGADRRVPLDLSAFHGIVFWAKSSVANRVKVMFNNSDTDVLGGRCGQSNAPTDQCWDSFSTLLNLTDAWQRFEVKFADLRQEGWGYRPTSGTFDATTVDLIGFQVNGPQTTTAPPVETDLWIDDLYFE